MLYITSSFDHSILPDKKITKGEVDAAVARGRGDRAEGMKSGEGASQGLALAVGLFTSLF